MTKKHFKNQIWHILISIHHLFSFFSLLCSLIITMTSKHCSSAHISGSLFFVLPLDTYIRRHTCASLWTVFSVHCTIYRLILWMCSFKIRLSRSLESSLIFLLIFFSLKTIFTLWRFSFVHHFKPSDWLFIYVLFSVA